MEQLLPLISDVGFPVVITLYLLHRIENKLDQLNESIQQLPKQLDKSYYRSPNESLPV